MTILEAVEAEDEKRERVVRPPLGPPDRALQQIDEQQPVRQSGQRIGHLGVGDVGERSGQARHGAVGVPDGRGPAEHPAERAVAMQKPVLALVMFVAVGDRCGRQRFVNSIDVVAVHARVAIHPG